MCFYYILKKFFIFIILLIFKIKTMKESIKNIVDLGGRVSFSNKLGKEMSIWQSDIRFDYWVNNKSFGNVDDAINYFIKNMKNGI